MKDRNEYGFYSSGYVFDRLVRTAVIRLRKTFPELEDKQMNLVRCTTHFVRQFADLKRIKCFTTDVRKEGDEYHVDIEIRNHSMLMAYGFFTFLLTNQQHKGEQNDQNKCNTSRRIERPTLDCRIS